MLRIIEAKLGIAGIKFALPERFCLDLDSDDATEMNGLKLISSEKDCLIKISTTDVKFNSAVDSLLDVFFFDVSECEIGGTLLFDEDFGYVWHEKPQSYEINGLKCAHTKYETSHHLYYELHFERVFGHYRQLEVLLCVPKETNVSLDAVLNRNNVKDFYNSFQYMR